MSEGYWIAPSGDIIPVPKSHIDMVIANPEKFRWTKEDVKKVYEKHDEPIGQEGKARAEIMIDLVKEGWIRVRYIPRSDFFTVQVNRLTERKKNQLYAFASEAIKGMDGVKFSPNSELKIMDLNTNPIETISLRDAVAFNFKESKVIDIKDYVLETRVSRIVRKVLDQLQ